MTLPPLVIMLAAARKAHADEYCPCLACARYELRDETPTRLHTSHAPKIADADGRSRSDEGGIGPPFTAAFHRLLSIRERPYQTEYVMRASLDEVVDWCRARHVTHDGICGTIVARAVRSGWEPDEIAVDMGHPEASVRSLLVAALAHAADFRQGRATRRPRTAADIVIERLPRPRRDAA